jgi:hypothetical protein
VWQVAQKPLNHRGKPGGGKITASPGEVDGFKQDGLVKVLRAKK